MLYVVKSSLCNFVTLPSGGKWALVVVFLPECAKLKEVKFLVFIHLSFWVGA